MKKITYLSCKILTYGSPLKWSVKWPFKWPVKWLGVLILCLYYNFFLSTQVFAAEIQWHRIKYQATHPLVIIQDEIYLPILPEQISPLGSTSSTPIIPEQNQLFDISQFADEPPSAISNTDADTNSQNEIATQNAPIISTHFLARKIYPFSPSSTEIFINEKHYQHSSTIVTIEPTSAYELSASTLSQEGDVFTILQQQNHIESEILSPELLSWNIDFNVICGCGFSSLKTFSGIGTFNVHFINGEANLIGNFNNLENITGNLEITSEYAHPISNIAMFSNEAEAKIATNLPYQNIIQGEIDILISGTTHNETTGQFNSYSSSINDFLAVQFIGK